MSGALVSAVAIAAGALCLRAVHVFNVSSESTSLPVLLAWLVMGSASAWLAYGIVTVGVMAPSAVAGVIISAAIALVGDRRRR